MNDLKSRIGKYLADHEVSQLTCPSHELLREALAALPDETSAPIEFEGCEFRGDPPPPFTDWNAWAASRPKRGVRIRAIERGDDPFEILRNRRLAEKATEHCQHGIPVNSPSACPACHAQNGPADSGKP